MVELYYTNNRSKYINEIGVTKLKVRMFRKAKKGVFWLCGDKLGIFTNIIGLIWMIL